MASNAVDVSMPKLIASLTLHVRFARIAGARLWLAAHIMRLAGAIAGCNIEVECEARIGGPRGNVMARRAGPLPEPPPPPPNRG